MSDTDVEDSTLMRRSLKEIAMSEEHLRTHLPALPNHCEICRRAKRMQRRKMTKGVAARRTKEIWGHIDLRSHPDEGRARISRSRRVPRHSGYL